jgi:predicted lysophospholipase L1 biosynthesis ABC-type transport system permease subunit
MPDCAPPADAAAAACPSPAAPVIRPAPPLLGWGTLLLLRRLVVRNLALRLAINRLLRQP